MAGYSSRSLADKLGIKDGMALYAINPPKDYRALLGIAASFAAKPPKGGADFVHLFVAGDLVDVKVCAVSDIWSGLKLIVRKHLR